MQADYVQRLRLTFRKEGPARYIGHLDLALTLERALNRARIPMAYTHGFNRRPRLQMASALPLGYTSGGELADIWLLERMEPAQAQRQLMARMAPGIDVYHVADVPLDEPALQTQTVASHYVATLLDPVDLDELRRLAAEMLAAAALVRVRIRGKRRKEYDLRPLIHHLAVATADDGAPQIAMALALLPSATGRPDEVLHELGLDPLAARIHRTRIVLEGDRGPGAGDR